MTYPKYRRAAAYRATIPALSGGLNSADAPFAVKDNQLIDLSNLWWKDGALRTRPGLQPRDDAAFSVTQYVTHSVTLSNERVRAAGKEGRLLLGSSRMGMQQNRIESLLVGDDGELTAFSSDVSYSFSIRHLLHVTKDTDGDSLGLVMTDAPETPLLELMTDGSVETPSLYAPTLLLQVPGNQNPSAEEPAGYPFESRNLLTDAFRVEYTVGENGVYFHLPSAVRGVRSVLTVEGTDGTGTVTHAVLCTTDALVQNETYREITAQRDGLRLTYDKDAGTFWFVNAGNSAVSMETTAFTALRAHWIPSVDRPVTRAKITGMRFGIWYGGDRTGLSGGTRFFVAGNPDYPHLLHYSSLNDATYFPENNYVYVGHPASAITALKQQGNMLVIFKDHELFAATYASGTLSAEDVLEGALIDAEVRRATFPITPISSVVGCDCPDSIALCGNRLVWATSDRKVYTLHGANSKSERNLRELSTPIESFLKQESAEDFAAASAVDAAGCYMLFVGRDVFLFHYDEQSFYNYSSFDAGDKPGKILAWQKWRLPEDFSFRYVTAQGEEIVLIGITGTHAVTYTLSGTQDTYYPTAAENLLPASQKTRPIEAFFCSKLFDFGAPTRRKRIQRLTLDAESDTEATVSVTYVTERKNERGCVTFGANELPVTLHPNGQRVRRFGLRCDTLGPMAFNGFCIRYEVQG